MSNQKIEKPHGISTWSENRMKTPKGDEKSILKEIIFPALISKHLKQYGQIQSMMDIGADDGEVTSIARINLTAINKDIQTIAIEPNVNIDLSKSYSRVYPISWEEFHRDYPDLKTDLAITSHQLYYLKLPLDGIGQMMAHINPLGSLFIILEDYHSGRPKLLQELGILNLEHEISTNTSPCIINTDNLARILSKMFSVTGPEIVNINVLFDNFNALTNRFR